MDRSLLVEFLGRRFGLAVDNLDDEEALFSSGLLDSFDVTEIVVFLEEHAGRTVEADDLSLANLDTVAQILRFSQELAARPA